MKEHPRKGRKKADRPPIGTIVYIEGERTEIVGHMDISPGAVRVRPPVGNISFWHVDEIEVREDA